MLVHSSTDLFATMMNDSSNDWRFDCAPGQFDHGLSSWSKISGNDLYLNDDIVVTRNRQSSNPMPIPYEQDEKQLIPISREEEVARQEEMEMILEQKNIEMLAKIRGITPEEAYIIRRRSDDDHSSPLKKGYDSDDDDDGKEEISKYVDNNSKDWEWGQVEEEVREEKTVHSSEQDLSYDTDEDEMFQLEM